MQQHHQVEAAADEVITFWLWGKETVQHIIQFLSQNQFCLLHLDFEDHAIPKSTDIT